MSVVLRFVYAFAPKNIHFTTLYNLFYMRFVISLNDVLSDGWHMCVDLNGQIGSPAWSSRLKITWIVNAKNSKNFKKLQLRMLQIQPILWVWLCSRYSGSTLNREKSSLPTGLINCKIMLRTFWLLWYHFGSFFGLLSSPKPWVVVFIQTRYYFTTNLTKVMPREKNWKKYIFVFVLWFSPEYWLQQFRKVNIITDRYTHIDKCAYYYSYTHILSNIEEENVWCIKYNMKFRSCHAIVYLHYV